MPVPSQTLPDLAAVAGPMQVGEDDADDQRRLDAFAKTGQQAAGERAEIHGSMLLADAGPCVGRGAESGIDRDWRDRSGR